MQSSDSAATTPECGYSTVISNGRYPDPFTTSITKWLCNRHVASGLIATFIEAPLELQKTLSIPSEHHSLCARNHPPIGTVGNAAGNTIDYMDLRGEPAPPAALPEGFTAKGVIALIVSALNGLAMVAAIAWYGLQPAAPKDEVSDGDDDRAGEERPLLASPESR